MECLVGVRGAIVVGGHLNGLGLVRALAARKIPVAVITTAPYDIAHRSRLVVEHEAVSGLDEHPERLVALLDRRAAGWAGWAVLPANDEALAALSAHHDHLASTYRVVAPPAETASYLLDKARMLDGLRTTDAPLDYERRRYLEQVVPQMSLALPEPERAQVRQAFDMELERLG